MNQQKKFYAFFACWLIASISTLGSLFFSEIMLFPPCSLCWYQRIFMYPLVLLFIPAMLNPTKEALRYLSPMALVGWFFSAYHNLLHWGIIPESAAPCREGVSCSTVYLDWLGFITIPLMAFFAFSTILAILLYLHRMIKNEK
ncbi:disulfide bond formation protein DsbB [Bacteriovorax sp. BSW11_IV]|uniref:disulfide oxidoreductase n=1 Tax=Bacteriovorax sp. BSW11_IV TaxID=1353529 RepID=UPI00038A1AB7|nr:disulfide oxidoreductase [Bacteriovorax sp. BSW11_IV]EQC48641.1 disulfide bond formation protein DsbB [Bacteriovorax sp. BSW11_IV]